MLCVSCGSLGTGSSNSSSGSSVLGSVLGSGANASTIGNVISSVIGLNKLTEKNLHGTWKYSGPGCAFTSDNALSRAGGEIVASKIEEKLKDEYSKLGFKSSNTYVTFNEDGTFAAKIAGKSWSGKYTFDEKTGALKMQGLLLTLNGYATRASGGVSLLFESKKLLTLIQTMASLSGNATISTIGDLSKNYEGVRLGFFTLHLMLYFCTSDKTSKNIAFVMAESVDIRELNVLIEQQSGFVTNLVTGMNQVIVGQKHLVDTLLISLLSNGRILLEGVPELAKTLAIKTLSQLVDVKFSRVQFTPDLLPADVVGTMIYSQKDESFHVKKGPVFANFVLADEINRAPAKVQSALLEAMQEHQVTIGEQTFGLPDPFLVMATQNPIEQEGTYPLPEAQVDRFMLKVVIDYPTIEEEKKIIRENLQGSMPEVKPVTTTDEILKAREVVRQVYIDEKIEKYIADIVFATRYPDRYGLPDLKDMITFGGSPRASINLAKASRAYAFIKHRGYVVPEDVRAVAHDVLRHRIGLSYEAEAGNLTSEEIVSRIINKVEVP